MIDYELRDLFNIDSTHKDIIIKGSNGTTLNNSDLYAEKFKLVENLCSEENLAFGSCESSYIEFTCNNSFSKIGKHVDVQIVLNGNTNKPFNVGRFYVVSDVISDDKKSRTITAFDSLYKVLNKNYSKWYKQQTFPMTLKAFRNAFFSHIGIEQNTASLVNDSMSVTKTIEPEVLSGLDIIQAICQINGVFGHLGRDNKFKYILLTEAGGGLYPSETLYPDNNLFPAEPNAEKIYRSYYSSVKYEDFTVSKIDTVTIQTEEGDIGVTSGPGTNTFVVLGNFLTFGLKEATLKGIADNLLNVVKLASYVPVTAVAKGNLCRELGDSINIYTPSSVINSYILNRSYEGIQSIFDTIEAHGTEEVLENSNSLASSVIMLKGKSNVLERSIDETKSTIRDVEAGLQTQITQNANGITLEAQKRTKGDEELSAAIKVAADNIKAEVVSQKGGSKQSFGWELVSDGFRLYSGGQTVFRCDNRGVYVEGDGEFTGKITANSGVIGDCKISNGVLTIAAANITTGTFSSARIPNLSASKITSGTISTARLSADVITTSNFTTQKITADMIESGVISASKITSGALTAARITTGTVNGYKVEWQRFSYLTGLNLTNVYDVNGTLRTTAQYPGQTPIGYLVNSVASEYLYSLVKRNA